MKHRSLSRSQRRGSALFPSVYEKRAFPLYIDLFLFFLSLCACVCEFRLRVEKKKMSSEVICLDLKRAGTRMTCSAPTPEASPDISSILAGLAPSSRIQFTYLISFGVLTICGPTSIVIKDTSAKNAGAIPIESVPIHVNPLPSRRTKKEKKSVPSLQPCTTLVAPANQANTYYNTLPPK